MDQKAMILHGCVQIHKRLYAAPILYSPIDNKFSSSYLCVYDRISTCIILNSVIHKHLRVHFKAGKCQHELDIPMIYSKWHEDFYNLVPSSKQTIYKCG